MKVFPDTTVLSSGRIRCGARAAAIDTSDGPPALALALKILGGDGNDALFVGEHELTDGGRTALFRQNDGLAGMLIADSDQDLEIATAELYRRMFAQVGKHPIYRIWNFVPHINRVDNGLENYRRFSRARSLAFEEAFGEDFDRSLPAACAVGTSASPFALAYVSGTLPPRHIENPLQVPAFRYPPDYGPRSPSFSRATVVDGVRGTEVFLSGTAAIRGHATVFAGDIGRQLECTLENMRAVFAEAGVADGSPGNRWRRHFRIYLRRPADLPAVIRQLERELLRPADSAVYLQADICRSDLLVEIEATLSLEV